MSPSWDVVVPTTGRPSLANLLEALAAQERPLPGRVIVVDDRGGRAQPLQAPQRARFELLRGAGAGPAAARNRGWRASRAEWVAFLDDDVIPHPDWSAALEADLDGLPREVGASQGRVRVPLPAHRRPTDRERGVAGLEGARWATADMVYRRSALLRVGGFDERFPRAYREDADLGLRVEASGLRIVRGSRWVSHPVPGGGVLASVRAQAGNADDVLMRALHGRDWRRAAGAPAGRRPRHLATTAAAVAAGGLAAVGLRGAAAAAAAGWLLGTIEFAWARIAPGPRTPSEVLSMAAGSVLIPPVAAMHTALGLARLPLVLRDRRRAPRPAPDAVLLDRDGTLVTDVPYNGDPDRVAPMPGAAAAVERLRAAGVGTAVISNQSGIARGLLTHESVGAVNRRVEELLGPLGPWLVCPHGPEEGCACRKPAPGLVLAAAERLGAEPRRCAVIGDIGADVEAARAAGARAILVPTPRTRAEEVAAAPEVAATLPAAVDLVLGERAA